MSLGPRASDHFHPLDRSAKAMFYRAHDRIADGNAAMMDMLRGPNPPTKAEIERLCDRSPRWERFRGLGVDETA